MPVINGREIRELWMVQFSSKRNEGGKEIRFVDIVAGMKVWAATGDEAVTITKKFAEEQEKLPWLGLRGVTPLDLIESHIINQPKVEGENEERAQPSKVSQAALLGAAGVQNANERRGDLLKDLPDRTGDLSNLTDQAPDRQLQLVKEPAASPQDETPGRHQTEAGASSPSGLIVKP